MYFITVTRKMGTDGSEIARSVATGLGYAFYDTEAIENTAREMGFIEEDAKADEKAPPLFERLFSHQPEIHLDRLNSVIYELASRGSAVFLGRGSHVLLRRLECALHVRVTASLERRLHNLVERGFQKEVALKAIRKSDQERDAFTKFAFGVDWENPELYDIVINMDNITTGLAVDVISYVAGTEQIKARATDAIGSLAMMALARRAEAALVDAGFSLTSLSLSVVKAGQIRLDGFADSQLDSAKAEEILRGVRSVEVVENHIRITGDYPERPFPEAAAEQLW
jgi:cytidylate kinase